MIRLLFGLLGAALLFPTMAQTIARRNKVRPVVHPQVPPPNLVKRQELAFWQKRRWAQNENTFTGYYRTPAGAYKGTVVYRHAGRFDFVITDPPDCLKRHSHYPCFRPLGQGVYYVHFSQPSLSIDDGLRAIEKILCEAHEQDARR